MPSAALLLGSKKVTCVNVMWGLTRRTGTLPQRAREAGRRTAAQMGEGRGRLRMGRKRQQYSSPNLVSQDPTCVLTSSINVSFKQVGYSSLQGYRALPNVVRTS